MNGLIPLQDYEAVIARLADLAPNTKQKLTTKSHSLQFSLQDLHINEVEVAQQLDDGEEEDATSSDDLNPGELKLPPELLRVIALVLFEEMRPEFPCWSNEVWPEEGVSALEVATQRRGSLHALIAFSSTSVMLRSLLGPLIWAHPEPLTHSLHLAALTRVLQFYVGPRATQHDRLPYPPPLLQSLRIRFPNRFPAVNQPALAHVLSAAAGAATEHSPNCRLQDFTFESEEAPSCSVLRALLSPPDRAAADRRIKESRDVLCGETARLKAQKLHSEQSQEIVEWERNAIGAYPWQVSLSQDEAEENCAERDQQHHDGLLSLSLSCGTFWAGHALLSSLRRLRHLRLTSYEAHLLPPHLPPLLLALDSPLKSLSMSTSKTAVLHVASLIDAGCFSQLTHLDVYPVTPEQPLARSLRSARRTLRVLRMTLDVSGAFQNYNALWKELTLGSLEEAEDEEELGMPELEILVVDPYPQQNTAPSFRAFLEACPKLRLVNGHDADRLRLTRGESLDPNHYTGALPY